MQCLKFGGHFLNECNPSDIIVLSTENIHSLNSTRHVNQPFVFPFNASSLNILRITTEIIKIMHTVRSVRNWCQHTQDENVRENLQNRAALSASDDSYLCHTAVMELHLLKDEVPHPCISGEGHIQEGVKVRWIMCDMMWEDQGQEEGGRRGGERRVIFNQEAAKADLTSQTC